MLSGAGGVSRWCGCDPEVACGRMTHLHELWCLETAPCGTICFVQKQLLAAATARLALAPDEPRTTHRLALTYELQRQGGATHDTADSPTMLIMGPHRSYSGQNLPVREPTSPSAQHRPAGVRSHGNPFSSKVNSVLSTSYADSEFREVLSMVDERGITNSPEVRRQIRLQVQKEVIDDNGEIIREFGHVADVGSATHPGR